MEILERIRKDEDGDLDAEGGRESRERLSWFVRELLA